MQPATAVPPKSGLIRALAVAWLVIFAIEAAQAESCTIQRVGTTELAGERGVFELPVFVNGSPAIQFIVDTGAERSAIDANSAAQLMLPAFGRRRTLTGTDGVKGRAFSDVSVGQLTLAGLAHAGFSLAVGELVKPGGRSSPGTIGADLLSRYDVEFDFPAKRLNLYRVQNCSQDSPEFKPWAQPYDAVPLKASVKNILSVPVSVNGKALELALDTGAVRTKLTFDAAAKLDVDIERLKAEAPQSTSYGSSGLAKTSYSQRFDKIQVGQSTYGNVELKVSDIKVEPYDGLLGLDFLRTRKIWVSYATRQVLVERQ